MIKPTGQNRFSGLTSQSYDLDVSTNIDVCEGRLERGMYFCRVYLLCCLLYYAHVQHAALHNIIRQSGGILCILHDASSTILLIASWTDPAYICILCTSYLACNSFCTACILSILSGDCRTAHNSYMHSVQSLLRCMLCSTL